MIVGFNYIAMTITGAMHLALGIFCFICSIIAFTTKEYYKIFVDVYSGYLYNNNLAVRTAAGSLIASLWILAVGVFGIIAGLKKNPEHRTYLMKTIYMVLAILSACFFSIGGIACFSIHSLWILLYATNSLYILFIVASLVMTLEFILAIVSSSICCCCSETRVAQTSRNVVVMQSGQAYVPPEYAH